MLYPHETVVNMTGKDEHAIVAKPRHLSSQTPFCKGSVFQLPKRSDYTLMRWVVKMHVSGQAL